MRLFDALKASAVACATRQKTGEFVRRPREVGDPNVVLEDKGKIKAFRTIDDTVWQRRPLREALFFEDWEPAKSRLAPTRFDGTEYEGLV